MAQKIGNKNTPDLSTKQKDDLGTRTNGQRREIPQTQASK